MARSGSEQRKASRRRRLGQGIALGTIALGVPALVNSIIAKRAAQLPEGSEPVDDEWRSERWASPGGELFVLTRGTSTQTTPIVFLHSLGPGHSHQQWIAAAESLAPQHPVILIDLPGWGRSARTQANYGLKATVEAILGLNSEFIDQPFHVVASGESAPVALSLAEAAPEAVKSVALSGPAGLVLDGTEPSRRDWAFNKLLEAPIFGTSAVNAYTRRSAIDNNLIRHQLAPPSAEQVDEHYRLAHLPRSTAPLSAFLRGRYERALGSLALAPDLKIWIAWGRKAVGEPVEDADLWLRHLQSAELVVFEQAASWPHVDQPTQFSQELTRFLP